ncbi:MAG: hypothetical protein PHQ12_07440 [Chthoniobacteraceae bacterium]|nr:hypothetical protein [Chthoniobacteraceae bacterium]
MKNQPEPRRKRPVTKIPKTFKLRADLCDWLETESEASGIKQVRLVENGLAAERAKRSVNA